MRFNKCLQRLTRPRRILIVTAPNWPSIVRGDESGTAGVGGSWLSWQILDATALPGASCHRQGKDATRRIHHSVSEQTAPCVSVSDAGQMEGVDPALN